MFAYQNWGTKSAATGDVYSPGSNSDEWLSLLDVFLLMMASSLLQLELIATGGLHQQAVKIEEQERDSNRRKLIGFIILTTKYTFKVSSVL